MTTNENMPTAPPEYSSTATYAPATATGALAYGLGFISYLPIPFLNFLITGVVMAWVYPRQQKKGGLVAENARQAANWGLTLIVIMIGMIGLTFGVVAIVTSVSDGPELGRLGLLPLLIYPATGIAHLIIIINGLVKANRGTVFRNPIAIPFLR